MLHLFAPHPRSPSMIAKWRVGVKKDYCILHFWGPPGFTYAKGVGISGVNMKVLSRRGGEFAS